MTNLDTLRGWLQSFGQRTIPVTSLNELADKSPLKRNQFFPALYTLRSKGEIDTESVESEGGRKFVTAIILRKMPSVEAIIKNDAAIKAKVDDGINGKKLPNIPPSPLIGNYLAKKNVLQKIVQQLADSGFDDPENMVNFEPDPLAEEAVSLFNLVNSSIDALNKVLEERKELRTELKIERDINKSYKESKAFRAEDYKTEAK